MLPVVVVMVLILVLAGLVVLYVAYPHRGEEVPAAAWLGEMMTKAVEAAPTIAPEEHDAEERSRLHDDPDATPRESAGARQHRTS